MPKDYSEWYNRNRAKVAARRRDRYHNDPDYRAKVLEKRRQARASGQTEEARTAATDPVMRKTPTGEVREGWRRGAVAEACGVSVSTIKRVLAKFPPPTLEGRQRAYTAVQVELVKTNYAKINDPKVRAEVEARWND